MAEVHMRRQTLVAVMAVLEMDESISNEQADMVADVLTGRARSMPSPAPTSTVPPPSAQLLEIKEYMSVPEAAKYISMSRRSIDTFRAEGDLPYHKVGKKVVIKRSDLDEFMARWRIDAREQLQRMGLK
jgi:excisionase family DNA binding protein